MIDLSSRFRRQQGVIKQEVAAATVLFNMEDGQYFALNEVGGRIWDLCDGTRPVSDIVTTIGEEFDAPSDTIRDDVLALLADFADAQLVVEAETAI